jgi:urea carboxylase
VDAGTFRYRIREVDFEPRRLFDDPWRYNDELLEHLYAD